MKKVLSVWISNKKSLFVKLFFFSLRSLTVHIVWSLFFAAQMSQMQNTKLEKESVIMKKMNECPFLQDPLWQCHKRSHEDQSGFGTDVGWSSRPGLLNGICKKYWEQKNVIRWMRKHQYLYCMYTLPYTDLGPICATWLNHVIPDTWQFDHFLKNGLGPFKTKSPPNTSPHPTPSLILS